MAFYRFSLRIPKGLHADALKLVRIRKEVQPGFSLNDLICQALQEYLARSSP